MSQRFFLLTAGSNARGQLGIGHEDDAHQWTSTTQQAEPGPEAGAGFPPLGSRVVDLAGGANHTVALIEDLTSGERTLWGTGDASQGQLGPHLQANGDAVSKFTRISDVVELFAGVNKGAKRRPQLIASAWESTYLALAGFNQEDDILVSLGSTNDFGQLGVEDAVKAGNHANQIDLRHVLEPANCAEGSCQLGRIEIVKLSAGVRHACAVIRAETVLTPEGPSPDPGRTDRARRFWTYLLGWGAARHGQLQSISADLDSTAVKPPRACSTPIVMATWDGSVAIDVQCGRDHSVVLIANSKYEAGSTPGNILVTLGSDRQHQSPFHPKLPPRSTLSSIQSVATMWNTTLTLVQTENRQHIDAWGAASRGQAGSNTTTSATVEGQAVETSKILSGDATILKMVAGSEHALLLLRTSSLERAPKEVWAWGWTEHGNLPVDDRNDPDDDVQIIWSPERIWPASGALPSIPAHGEAERIWAGCATTFLQISIPYH
ncbi:unnamed protein product [Tilletia controversa]|uniref:RCC1/BLIP-II n=3 Tax=Tilletia TaxID=13289 RepID=A0A8X7SWS0_9BASI|nr:hypothetical protein CF336_g4203 [Tilletia laevis]KAE8196521.1 hypothetical protein CF328_g4116 [Tilletia controversa]KAE8263223.1 hypothetical protein A4X03_0g1841 [Tilletia caries]KAE8202428.1 hypothetical protein CF335_g3420 [Tilletia laevis]KAE8246822.1 hypothetical protein A4X06_0g4864 [Tilletia controversa]